MIEFICRKEFFGGLVYNLQSNSIVKLDQRNYRILEEIKCNGFIEDSNKHSTLGVSESIKELIEIGLIDEMFTLVETRFFNRPNPAPSLSAPTTIFLEITRSCDLRCKHCFNISGNPKENELSTIAIRKLIQEIANAGVFNIKISGGEPFCRKDIFAILNTLEDSEINFIINTNGQILSTGNYVEELKSYDYLQSVRVSIDGLREINDKVRGVNSFERSILALKRLMKNEIPCELNFIINKINYKQIADLIQYVEKHLKCKINLGMIKNSGRAKESGLTFNESEMEDCIFWLKKQFASQSYIKKYILLEDIFLDLFGKNFGCPAGQFTCVITPQGDVYPCGLLSMHDQFKCGNITQTPLNTIWLNNLLHFRYLQPNAICNKCEFFTNGCVGACRANSFNSNGDIGGIDPNCKLFITDFMKYFRPINGIEHIE